MFGKQTNLFFSLSFFITLIPILTRYSIEDNILVTETGYENLTTAIKEPSQLEALMASS